MNAVKLIINGANGRMGKILAEYIMKENEHTVVGFVDPTLETNREAAHYSRIFECSRKADAIIDFSSHFAVPVLCSYAVKTKTPLVIATTGHTEKERSIILSAAKRIPVFYSPNMSPGVSLTLCIAKIAAKAFPEAEIEIVEKHHSQKTDVPSGTALFLAEGLRSVRPELFISTGRRNGGIRNRNELCIHSLRLGSSVGSHEIVFAMPGQTVTIRHEAHDRLLFVRGALAAAEYITDKECGIFCPENMIEK